jgi:hypothetical protein
MRKITGNYDEVIVTTDDGGLLWKKYCHGCLVDKQKYLGYSIKEARRKYPAAQVIRLPVLAR